VDADAQYEYVFCLNKIGSEDLVAREYQKLAEMNAKLADKLRKKIGLKNVPAVPAATMEKKTVHDGTGIGTGNGYGNGTYR
jgi:hypothetical protein